MAYTQSDLDAVRSVITGTAGAKQITLSSGESIERRPLPQLIELEKHIMRALYKRRPRAYGVYSTKGV